MEHFRSFNPLFVHNALLASKLTSMATSKRVILFSWIEMHMTIIMGHFGSFNLLFCPNVLLASNHPW